jgi:hypothetical protein
MAQLVDGKTEFIQSGVLPQKGFAAYPALCLRRGRHSPNIGLAKGVVHTE